MISKAYLKMELSSPIIFKNKFVGKRVLIIGTGMSTKKLVKYKHKLNFDAVIGLNFSTVDFEDQITHHLILEKNPINSYADMIKNPNKYSKVTPRILNFKGLHRFPEYLNIVKTTRTNFDGKPNIREYRANGCEGLLAGPRNKQGLMVGTVALQAIHFAGILGCKELYIAGADLVFGKKFDHYYEDRSYRDSKGGKNKSPIIKLARGGTTYDTTEYFRDSAVYLDKVVNTMCRPAGMEVYSFSEGLLTAPIKLDIDKFFA